MASLESTNRPLVKRSRASIACDTCRQTKSKCDGKSPVCERCNRLRLGCVYSQPTRDKRLERREEQKANLDLRAKVRELEAQLAAVNGAGAGNAPAPASQSQQGRDHPANPTIAARPSESQRVNSNTQSHISPAADGEEPSVAEMTHESPVDVLAAGVFDHPSSAGHLCYFGSSSNHAIFWSLTASIANMGYRSSHLFQEPLRPGQAQRGPRLPLPPPSFDTDAERIAIKSILPERSEIIRLISRFFATIGATLPYVTEQGILRALDKTHGISRLDEPSFRATQGLLHIICAHAMSTLDEASPEPFYRQTLRLLDPKTLYMSGVELLQTLVLLAVYQQNSKRSTESLATHALCVKTAYHLGLHASFVYDSMSTYEKEARSRLWFAVVNQDRLSSTALGQPCMIPLQHARDDITAFIDTSQMNRTVETRYTKEAITYFRRIISLHQIMGVILDDIYDSNMSTSTSLKFPGLLSKTMEISLSLENWRRDNLGASLLDTDTDFSTWTVESFEAEANRDAIILSLYYYRTAILAHAPLLMMTLDLATNGSGLMASAIARDGVKPLLKANYNAVVGFHHIIRAILLHNQNFLRYNPIWWMCNYGSLTISLHMFTYWVASRSPDSAFIALNMDTASLETRLRDFLDTLKAIGGSSAMSVKSHRCLHRHLTFLSSVESPSSMNMQPRSTPGSVSGHATSYQVPPGNSTFADAAPFVGNTAPVQFGDFDFQNFFDIDSFGMDLQVSDFNAFGLI